MKRFLCFLLILGITASFCACSSKKQKPDNDIIGVWTATVDSVTYYYEFRDDDTLVIYADSNTLTTSYSAEEDGDHLALDVPSPSAQFDSYGAVKPNRTGEFTVTGGDRDDHSRTAELIYTGDDSEELRYTLDEVEAPSPSGAQIPADFTADPQLTGSWINNYSNEYGSQHFEFFDDGRLEIAEIYNNSGVTLDIRRSCTYSAKDGVLTMYYKMGKETASPLDYQISGNTLEFDGQTYTREGTQSVSASQSTDATDTTDAIE